MGRSLEVFLDLLLVFPRRLASESWVLGVEAQLSNRNLSVAGLVRTSGES